MIQTLFAKIALLPNFVADALNILGFDPVERFVDVILDRANT